MANSVDGLGGHLFGSSGRHARVVVLTITQKEFPAAREVFAQCGNLVDVDELGAFTNAQFADAAQLPYVIVRGDRSNIASGDSVRHWVRTLRPQWFIVVGTAGGICRPVGTDHKTWDGPRRGDVFISEYVHYADYMKVVPGEILRRYIRMDQPSTDLYRTATNVMNDPAGWRRWLGGPWNDASRLPDVREGEILSGEQIQDDPVNAFQQYLMASFDRAAATEMESAGVARALHELRLTATYAPGFITVRGVSDLIWARGRDCELSDEDLELAHAFDSARTSDDDLGTSTVVDKTAERDDWSGRAATAAAAVALEIVRRTVKLPGAALESHPAVEGVNLMSAGDTSLAS